MVLKPTVRHFVWSARITSRRAAATIARLAAQRRGKTGLAAMERAVADMEQSLGDPAAFTEADILFHLGMALATGNSMIRVQMEGLRSVQREVSELFSRRANRSASDWKATISRHRAIYEAIAAGDADLAEQRIIDHFEAADIASLEVAGKLESNAEGSA
jgi:GntR family transcriptional regulator, transcriptional repressor for pyruvate dehydrogenase complex